MNVSQYGKHASPNDLVMSLTRPIAMAHNPASSRLPRALYRNGAKGSIYFSKSSSSAVDNDPTAPKMLSGTLDLGPAVLRIWRKTCIMRSA